MHDLALFPKKDKSGRPIIGSCKCDGCGVEVPLKINAAGCVYYFCAAPLKYDENGKVTERCYERHNKGKTSSKRMINEFLEAEEVQNVEEPENREIQGNIEHNPAERAGADGDSRNSSGFGGALKHFLTAAE